MATVKETKNVTPVTAPAPMSSTSLAPATQTLPGNLATLANRSEGFSFKDFENPELGESFGGTYTPIQIAEQTVSNLLKFVKNTKLNLIDNGETKVLNVPVCEEVVSGKLVAMPIGAVFGKHWDAAKVNAGDTLIIGRYPNKVKKTGKGGGSAIMQIYGIKIISRASQLKELTAAIA